MTVTGARTGSGTAHSWPLIGRDDILRLFEGLRWRDSNWLKTPNVRLVRVNGYLGAILDTPEGPITVAFPGGSE